MTTKTAKIFSEVKIARFERKHVNHQKWHKITVRRFNKASRKDAKQNLKAFLN